MSRPKPRGSPSPLVCGVDEAGRGPLAGAVFAAAVILDRAQPIHGLRDSKQLAPATRTRLSEEIKQRARAWAIASASPAEIDTLNILQASLLAMRRAVEALDLVPGQVLVDGNRCPALAVPSRAIVRGDALHPAISAASILAKVARDHDMLGWHALYPDYGFDKHKGYPTPDHLRALAEHGVSPIHRKAFAPVARHLK